MARLLRSIRTRLLVATLLPAVLLLVGTFFAFNAIELSHQTQRDVQIADKVASAIGDALEQHPRAPIDYRVFQEILGTSELTVTRAGRTLYQSPTHLPRRSQVVREHFEPGGLITIRTDVDTETGLTLKLTAVAAVALGLIVLVGLLATMLVMRAISEPVARAVRVADRLAGGDLDARMGATGDAQFNRLAHAFDDMAERIQETDTVQEQFLSDLAHEIATPINGVVGLARGALDQTIQPEGLAEAGQLLEEEAARLDKLLADLRQLRMPTLASAPDWQWVRVDRLVEALGRRFAPDAERAGLELVTRTRRIDLVSDPHLIERVVTNFLTNALRYTPAGGTVTLQLRRSHQEAVISVADTGVGISAEAQGRIFDRFYRADNSRDRVSGGTGLGLAIARRAASALGARIELDSRPGEGSEFRLVLPVAPPEHPAPNDPSAGASRATVQAPGGR